MKNEGTAQVHEGTARRYCSKVLLLFESTAHYAQSTARCESTAVMFEVEFTGLSSGSWRGGENGAWSGGDGGMAATSSGGGVMVTAAAAAMAAGGGMVARGGVWVWGSGRSEWGKYFLYWPEKFSDGRRRLRR
ncbi:hypothetical protein Tco_1363259 [Tanacetum coccineum]